MACCRTAELPCVLAAGDYGERAPWTVSDELREAMVRIAQAVAEGRYRYTLHGAQKRIERGISGQEIEAILASGEVIEHYPNHRYGPCCLILGSTAAGRQLHVLCSDRSVIDIITVYDPEPKEWEPDLRTRRTAK